MHSLNKLPNLAARISESMRAWQRILGTAGRLHIPMAAVMLLALNAVAAGATINFDTDPFQGPNVRNIAGRQVVGGELFVAFNTATDTYVFDETAFGMGDQVHFANGLIDAIPSTGVNVVVLRSTDNDANPLTPFGAGNAADLLASRITDPGPGVFIYFNSGLDLPRLVYSDDLSSNTADLKILARMLNLNGQTGINTLPNFSASNFDIANSQTVPEPSGLVLMSWGIALLAISGTLRRFGF